MITREQAGHIAQLARTIRPRWDELTTINIIHTHQSEHLTDIVCAVIFAATNPNADTPRAIDWPEHWHRKPDKTADHTSPRPGETCTVAQGQAGETCTVVEECATGGSTHCCAPTPRSTCGSSAHASSSTCPASTVSCTTA